MISSYPTILIPRAAEDASQLANRARELGTMARELITAASDAESDAFRAGDATDRLAELRGFFVCVAQISEAFAAKPTQIWRLVNTLQNIKDGGIVVMHSDKRVLQQAEAAYRALAEIFSNSPQK